jgi:hypothetical protein
LSATRRSASCTSCPLHSSCRCKSLQTAASKGHQHSIQNQAQTDQALLLKTCCARHIQSHGKAQQHRSSMQLHMPKCTATTRSLLPSPAVALLLLHCMPCRQQLLLQRCHLRL